MNSYFFALFVSFLACASLTDGFPALRKKFNKLVVFGDSYSDNGNAYKLAGTDLVTDDYYQGRFSNGLVWPEYLASFLGAEIEDFAYAGASTDNDAIQGFLQLNETKLEIPGLKQQVESYKDTLKFGTDLNKTLVATWPVGSDYQSTELSAVPEEVVGRLAKIWVSLYEIGIRNILAPSLPDFSLLPIIELVNKKESKSAAFEIYLKHNEALKTSVASFKTKYPDAIIYTADYNKYQRNTTGLEQYADITNTKDACFKYVIDKSAKPCSSPEDYFFWDPQHITTKAHLGLAFVFLKALAE
ncbi:hypothetical protein G9A89_023002 [Geosiphon pyriformis]|nr:hypothetical protein G9A89_023002 [Geosiphon pyriformis]